MSYYYGEELLKKRNYAEAYDEFRRGLTISKSYTDERDISVSIDRAKLCRYIAICLMEMKGDPNEVMKWLLRYVAEYPFDREAWFELANGWKVVGDYVSALGCASHGILLGKDNSSARYNDWCWDSRAEDFVEGLKSEVRKIL